MAAQFERYAEYGSRSGYFFELAVDGQLGLRPIPEDKGISVMLSPGHLRVFVIGKQGKVDMRKVLAKYAALRFLRKREKAVIRSDVRSSNKTEFVVKIHGHVAVAATNLIQVGTPFGDQHARDTRSVGVRFVASRKRAGQKGV